MSNLRFGLDPNGTTARVVELESSEDGNSVITCRSVSTIGNGGMSSIDSHSFTLVIDDTDAVVRIVRPAIIEPALAEQAAKYEAEIALLSNGSNLSTQVRPISAAGSRDWLAVSIHKAVAGTDLCGISAQFQSDHQHRFLPRSVALGSGLLFACEPLENSLTVVVQPTDSATSICFLTRQSVIGTARLSKLNPTASESEVAGWLSELKMVVGYRLSTDLAAFGGAQPPTYLWAGTESELDRLRQISPIDFTAPQPKAISFSARSEITTLTPEWLVALGAALN